MGLTINDDGIYDSETFTVSCLDALKFGTAYADIYDDIVIGTDSGCLAIFNALSSGILSRSKNIWSCGNCTQAQLKYAITTLKINAGIFIESSCGNIKLIPFSKYGFSLDSSEERTLSDTISNVKLVSSYSDGKITDSSTLNEMYNSEIKYKQIHFPAETNIQINSSNPLIKNLFHSICTDNKSTGEYRKSITFQISADGLRASAYSFETGFVFYEKLILICCLSEFKKGNDIPLPYSFPVIADRLASQYGRSVYRFNPSSDKVNDISIKSIVLDFPFLNDGAALIFSILKIMETEKKSLDSLVKDIPEFTTTVKYINIKNNPEDTIKQIQNKSENNICYEQEDGRIIAKASKSGKSLILYAESYRAESADELCSSWMLGTGIR